LSVLARFQTLIFHLVVLASLDFSKIRILEPRIHEKAYAAELLSHL